MVVLVGNQEDVLVFLVSKFWGLNLEHSKFAVRGHGRIEVAETYRSIGRELNEVGVLHAESKGEGEIAEAEVVQLNTSLHHAEHLTRQRNTLVFWQFGNKLYLYIVVLCFNSC